MFNGRLLVVRVSWHTAQRGVGGLGGRLSSAALMSRGRQTAAACRHPGRRDACRSSKGKRNSKERESNLTWGIIRVEFRVAIMVPLPRTVHDARARRPGRTGGGGGTGATVQLAHASAVCLTIHVSACTSNNMCQHQAICCTLLQPLTGLVSILTETHASMNPAPGTAEPDGSSL